MIKIKSPATSANLGSGFDCFGLALSLYNEFEVDLSSTLVFENVDKNFANKNNLFVKAFDETAKLLNKKTSCYLKYKKINVPFCRGLGSSATLIVSGAISANYLLGNKLKKNELLKICNKIEGHPDNVSACLFGGFNYNLIDKELLIHNSIKISNNIFITVIIPNYMVSTKKARSVLSKNIPINDAVFNISHSVFMIDALKYGDHNILSTAINDKIHIDKRKKLIKDYDSIKNLCMKKGATAFTISGSGSSLIVFSKYPNFSKRIKLNKNFQILDLKVDSLGTRILK